MTYTNTSDKPISVGSVTVQPGESADLDDVQVLSPAARSLIRPGKLVKAS